MAETLATRLELVLVTPDREIVRESVGGVSLPAKTGMLGILPGHAPLLTELMPGEVAYTHQEATSVLAVSWGFAEVLPDRVIVLAETAERAEEIDLERAQRSRERAEERLKKFSDPEIDFNRARAALARSLARIQVVQRART